MDYGYIWNGWADGVTEYKAENMSGLSWSEMLSTAKDDPHPRLTSTSDEHRKNFMTSSTVSGRMSRLS